jgi:hypothetical protein
MTFLRTTSRLARFGLATDLWLAGQLLDGAIRHDRRGGGRGWSGFPLAPLQARSTAICAGRVKYYPAASRVSPRLPRRGIAATDRPYF